MVGASSRPRTSLICLHIHVTEEVTKRSMDWENRVAKEREDELDEDSKHHVMKTEKTSKQKIKNVRASKPKKDGKKQLSTLVN